jgi:hypothetical protein
MRLMKWLWMCLMFTLKARDRCAECKGAKGGAYGNENVIGGRLVCDYCHADMMRKAKDRT